MIRSFAPLVLLLAAPATAQPASAPGAPSASPKALTLQQSTALKCSTAFALAAAAQARGDGKQWPAIMPRGREYMVRAAAQVMDETGLDRPRLAAEMTAQAKNLAGPGELAVAMPPCLLLLDASGL